MPTIRLANAGNIEAIAALHVASWKSAYRGILPDAVLDTLSTEDRVRDWTEWFANPLAHTYIASQARVLIGFARILPALDAEAAPPSSGEISHLYVAAGSQRMGVGRALLAKSLEDVRERGFERAVLWVLEKNYRARAFYERAGFKLDGQRRNDPERLGADAGEVRYQISVREP